MTQSVALKINRLRNLEKSVRLFLKQRTLNIYCHLYRNDLLKTFVLLKALGHLNFKCF